MFKLIGALTIAVLFARTMHAQAPTKDSVLSEKVNHLMNTHIGVENTVPPGWSIEAKPVATARGENDTVISQVHIFIHGAPEGVLFEQQSLPVGDDKPVSEISGISVGKGGILMCAGRSPQQCGDANNPDDPIEFTAQSIKGEPLRFLFASSAGTIGIVLVPNPVAGRDHGCTLSAVRLTGGFELALITGTGYPPKTDIHYNVTPNSSGEQVAQADERGVFRFSLIPFTKPGQTNGTLKLKVKTPSCSPELSYDFGRQQ